MALWAKIQSLNAECQREILSLYNEEAPEFSFPIELRNIFAEIIENAVCGGNSNSLDGGLDPANPQHREPILTFFTTLIGLLEERLGNTQCGDQFFTRHKLSESLTKLKEHKQTNPIGLFEYIRNRLKAELTLVSQQEAASNGTMFQERDAIMENIQQIRGQAAGSASILKDIRSNEEHFALNCNRKQEFECIINNPDQLRSYNQQVPDYETRLRENLAVLEGNLQQNIRNLQVSMQRFKDIVTNNLNNLATLEGVIVEKVAIWKHEQQKQANGIPHPHSIPLDKLQIWCEELADLIWKHYEQLNEAERILKNGVVPGNNSDLNFVQNSTEEVIKLLQELLNHSLIVEEQPPQIIKMRTKFPKAVIVSLLVGKRLNIHMDRPMLSTNIISDEQAKSLPVADEVDTIGEITNGQLPMECKEESERLHVAFRSMQLRSIKRTDRRGNVSSDRVMEEKSCLYFVCLATVGPLRFKVSTISLPVVVISHGSQEALAVATISWDNAFGEIGRVPFEVPKIAPWSVIAQILNAKFVEVAGRGLTQENLECLARKAFHNRQPQPETITWSELCKINLPQRNFTFWAWFHAALRLIEKKETHLKEVWKAGLIMGFVDRESAEKLISQCEPGTFLLRFADSIAGAITIALFVRPGAVVSLNPFQLLDLQTNKLSMQIKEIQNIKYLFQTPHCIPKDDAFGQFYEKETTPQGTTGSNGKPYVPIMPTIPDGDAPNGSQTPQPTYDGSQRWSLPELPPLLPEQFSSPSHSQSPLPFFSQPPPSPGNFYEMQSMQSTDSGFTMATDSTFMATSENSQASFLYPPSVSSVGPVSPFSSTGELETPRPTDGNRQVFGFSSDPEAFDDLIRVIRDDTEIDAMES